MDLKVLEKFFLTFSIIVIIGVLSFKIFLLFYEPIGFDEAGLGFIADQINRGFSPYVDFFDHKPPLNYYPLSGFFKIFGSSVFSVHLFSLIIFLIFLISVFFGIKILIGFRSAIFSSAIASIMFLSNSLTNELPMTLFGFWSIFFYLIFLKKNKPLNLFFSGIFIAFSIWFKQPGVIFFFAIFFHQIYLLIKKNIDLRIFFKNNLLLILGSLIISVPFLSFSITKFGWSNFFFAIIKFNLLFSGSTSRIFSVGKLFLLILTFFNFLIVFWFFNKKMFKKEIIFLKVSLIITLIFLLLNQEIFEQHLIQLIPLFLFIVSYSVKYEKKTEIKKIFFVLIFLFLLFSLLIFLNNFIRSDYSLYDQQKDSVKIGSITNNSKNIFSDTPVYSFPGKFNEGYFIFYLAPSTGSVFKMDDLCEYLLKKDYLVLSSRQKYLSETNSKCIRENFIIETNFSDHRGEEIEVWKKVN